MLGTKKEVKNKGQSTFNLWIIVILGIAIVSWNLGVIVGTNYSFYNVSSESMVPNLNKGDLLIVQKSNNDVISSFNNLKIGDIILFKSPRILEETGQKEVIVHRVHSIKTDIQGNRVITTKGDANDFPIEGIDHPVKAGNYIGKVSLVIPKAGLLSLELKDLVDLFHVRLLV
ncbi:MAG TPA: signal peptidase I [Nitrososphaeraceae archaeon]|nr:signal peptidase I [Nitrososphaeraceae archaeon]